MSKERTYVAIDLKSFYASVECVARGLDPLTTNLVVADITRTEKTICLAVSPSLKAWGIPGRPRLFEVVQRVKEINAHRKPGTPPLEYIVAPPRMAEYLKVSSQVYATYLQFISAEDIHVYSIDEVFMDVTAYLRTYGCTAHELTVKMIREVLRNTGITATAGIAPNLYLAKIAMDIEAKHSPADKDGVRIAELDQMSYRRKYWEHTPLTDFWRVGRGIAAKLEANGMRTMGDIARRSLTGEESLYRLFGVNAELLIDHAWGWEPCTIADIKAYKPSTHSLSSGQVLAEPYSFKKARVVVQEMADSLALDLVDKRLVCDQIVIWAGYENWEHKPAHGSCRLGHFTSSSREIMEAAASLFDRLVDSGRQLRRLGVAANHVVPEGAPQTLQLSLFNEEGEAPERERRRQEAILAIKKKYGKNAILKGLNFEEGATQRQRNEQVGGHKA